MRRSLFILLGVLAAGAVVFAGSYLLAQRICARQFADPVDDLGWLRREFHLSDAEMARIRELHEGYLPICGEMCRLIEARKREVEASLAGATNVSAVAEQQLADLAALRARCQTQMLRHFAEVSQAMPPEQGHRYFSEMQRLTLGFHEQFEQSMSDQPGQAHGNR